MSCAVVVPLYNKEKTVLRSLESIRNQTFTDFEAVIVDDGSSDRGPEVVQEFLDRTKDPRFRYVRQANAGPGAARNRAVRETSAPWVAFLDADDEWLPGHLERCCAELKQNPGAAAACALYFEEPRGNKSGRDTLRKTGLREGALRVQADTPVGILLGLLALMTPQAVVVRRDLFDRFGGFVEGGCRFAEDSFLFLNMALHHPVLILDEETVVFHRDASELSGNYRTARPVEPFLERPEPIRDNCPRELRPLLDRFLAARAHEDGLRAVVLG